MITLALLLAAAQPGAAADQFAFDVQCMVATQMATEQVKGPLALATQMSAMFYFGRVDALLSGAQLEERLGAEAKKLEGRPLGPLLKQCGDFMEARGKAMEKLGADLEAREKASDLH